MNLFEFELLKLKRNHYFNIFFFVLIAFIFIVEMSFRSEKISNYSISIGYIDLEQNSDSLKYLENLKKKDIIELVELKSKEEGMKKLSDSFVEAILVIPEGYFSDILNSKIEYTYLEYSMIAPSLIDLLADDLMLPISRAKLVNATKIYVLEDWKDRALYYYDDFIQKNSFYLNSDLKSISNAGGLNKDYQEKKIEMGRNVYGYGISIYIFTSVFALCLSDIRNDLINYRKKSIHKFYFKSFVWQRAFDYMKLLILWVVLCMVIGYHVGFKMEYVLTQMLFGFVIILLYYELISLIYRFFDKSHIGNLIAIGFVMLSSIFGGAYFPTDLFPKAYDFVLGWIPFYQFNKLYYAGVLGKVELSSLFYICVYSVLTTVFVFVNYKRNAV